MQITLPISGTVVTMRDYISHRAARAYANTLTKRFLAPENKLAFEKAILENPNLKISDFLNNDDADDAREAVVLASIEKAVDKDGNPVVISHEWIAAIDERDYEPMVAHTNALQEANREKVKN